jgi:hypothetical protein
MLFIIGEATVFSSVPGSSCDDESRVLKLKNPRTSVGAGAFDWAAFSGQPATALGLISPSTTTRPTTNPDACTELQEAARRILEAVAAVIDQ